MPVTKTSKRALRSSEKKQAINKLITKKLGIAIRLAKKSKSPEKIAKAISLADRAAKKAVMHRNKTARIKSQLTKLLAKHPGSTKKPAKPQTSSKKSVGKSK